MAASARTFASVLLSLSFHEPAVGGGGVTGPVVVFVGVAVPASGAAAFFLQAAGASPMAAARISERVRAILMLLLKKGDATTCMSQIVAHERGGFLVFCYAKAKAKAMLLPTGASSAW